MAGRGNRGRTRAGAAMLAALSLALAVPAVVPPDKGSPSAAVDPIDPAGVPAAVAQRLLHRPRLVHGHRQAAGSQGRLHAGNVGGKPIDPHRLQPLRRLQPRQPIITRVPGLDARRARPDRRRAGHRLGAATPARDQPIVVIDAVPAGAGRSFPSSTRTASSRTADLLIRPAVNFREGHRYIVALRGLRDDAGAPNPGAVRRSALPRPPAIDHPAVSARRPHMERSSGLTRGRLARRASIWPGTSPWPAEQR